MKSTLILDPIVQHGFLGLSPVLLAILVWLVKRLIHLLEATNTIVHENTQAIRSMDLRNTELLRLTGSMRDSLLVRPCIANRQPPRSDS